jgi:hypothetical protein
MFNILFHRKEVEPSGSSATSTRGQDEPPPAVSQQFISAAAAGSSFPAKKTSRDAKFNTAASRQASQSLQLEQQEDEQGSGAAAPEDDAALVARPAKLSCKPARLQVDTAVENCDELQLKHVAVSALSAPAAAVTCKPAARQQPERTSAAAKPWKKQEQPQQQQQQPQQQQQHVSRSVFGLCQAGAEPGGVEELQKQLMLEAKAREVSRMRRHATVTLGIACMSCHSPVGLVQNGCHLLHLLRSNSK